MAFHNMMSVLLVGLERLNEIKVACFIRSPIFYRGVATKILLNINNLFDVLLLFGFDFSFTVLKTY